MEQENQDFYNAPNLRNSLLNDLQLPEQSTITFKKNNNQGKSTTDGSFQNQSNKDNRYLQSNQDNEQHDQIRISMEDFGELPQVSSIQKRNQLKPQQNKRIADQDNNLQREKSKIIPSTSKRIQSGISRVNNKGRGKKPVKNTHEQKQQVDIDKEIGQVAEWEYRGTAKNNGSDKQDSQEQQQRYNAQETIQAINIKKKLKDKVKNMDNKGSLGSAGGPGSLMAKAEQLKMKNDQAKRSEKEKILKTQLKHSQIKQKTEQHNQESDIDDHWDKINSKVKQESKINEPIKKKLTHQEVIKYYQGLKLQSQRRQVQNQQEGDAGQQEGGGCLGLFGCIRQNKKKGQRKMIEKQILCLAKVQLQNSEQNMYVLKQIWTKLTGQKFQRYGNHWNKIGFQGRDPSTDLRSTGILSIIQWYCFICSHHEYSTKIYNFTIELQFPLALSVIKITSVFLGLLRNNRISGNTFKELEQIYNALHFAFFSKIMTKQIGNTPIGEFIDKNIEQLKKNHSKTKKVYSAWKQTGKSLIY